MKRNKKLKNLNRIVYGTALALTALAFSPKAIGQEGEGVAKGITWYGVLEDGLAEAKRTNKPILLTSAAPQCIGVPGIW